MALANNLLCLADKGKPRVIGGRKAAGPVSNALQGSRVAGEMNRRFLFTALRFSLEAEPFFIWEV